MAEQEDKNEKAKGAKPTLTAEQQAEAAAKKAARAEAKAKGVKGGGKGNGGGGAQDVATDIGGYILRNTPEPDRARPALAAALTLSPHDLMLHALRVGLYGDANETAAAWRIAIERRDGPVALVLTSQGLPVLDLAK